MLARDWYYNQRRQLGRDSAVASIYDRHDDSDIRARAALTMLGVQRGWRVADIGCGNGVLACGAAQMGAEGDRIDILPAALALAETQSRLRQRRAGVRTSTDGRRGRRNRYFAGDAGAGGNPGPRPQSRDPDPVRGLIEFRLPAQFLRSRCQRV